MDYAADDSKTIRARMEEIRRDSAPIIGRLDSLHDFELDAAGAICNQPRMVGESDYAYRSRLKLHTQTGLA